MSEVVVTVDTDARIAALRIVWQGGASTELEMTLTKIGGHFRATDEDTVQLVRRLAEQYDDTTIAMILSGSTAAPAPGCRSPRAECTPYGSPATSPPTARNCRT